MTWSHRWARDQSGEAVRPSPLKPLLAESIGTFVLVLVGCGAIVAHELYGTPDDTGIALSFGLVVAVMVATFGGVSGAHLNPAVTVAAAVTGRFSWRLAPAYVVAQCTGAVLAAGVLRVVAGTTTHLGATSPSVAWPRALLIEVLITFVLMAVIVAVSSDRRLNTAAAGAVIGATVALASLWAGPFTGASMNPARSFGPALVSGHLGGLWLYVVGPIMGAALGAAAGHALRGVTLSAARTSVRDVDCDDARADPVRLRPAGPGGARDSRAG